MIKASQIEFNLYSNKLQHRPLRRISLEEFIYLHKKLQSAVPNDTSLSSILKDFGLSEKTIQKLLQIAASKDPLIKERMELKEVLPAIIASTLNDRNIPMNQCVYSGYIIIDIDYAGATKKEDLSKEDIERLKLSLKKLQIDLQDFLSEKEQKALLASFISPTGTGLKLLFAAEFENNVYKPELVQAFYKNLENILFLWKVQNNVPYDFSIDVTNKNINRLCFILFTDGIELYNYKLINNEYYFDYKPLNLEEYKDLDKKSQILSYEDQKELKEIEDRSLRRLQEFYILASRRFPNRLSFERGNRNNSIYFYSVLVYSYDKIHNKRPTPIDEVVEICTQIMERVGSLDHTLRDDEIRRTVESAKNSVGRYGILHEDIKEFCKGYRPTRLNSVQITLENIQIQDNSVFIQSQTIEEFYSFLENLESKTNKRKLEELTNNLFKLYFKLNPHIKVKDENLVITYYKVEGAFCIPYYDPRTLKMQSTQYNVLEENIVEFLKERIFFENIPESEETEKALEYFLLFLKKYINTKSLKSFLTISDSIPTVNNDKILQCFTNTATDNHFYPLTKEYFVVVDTRKKSIELKHYTEFTEKFIISKNLEIPFETITKNFNEEEKKAAINKIKEVLQKIKNKEFSLDFLKNTDQGQLLSLLSFGYLHPNDNDFSKLLSFLGFSACPSTRVPNPLIIIKDINSSIHNGAQGGTGKSTFLQIFYEPYLPFSYINSIAPKGFPLSNLRIEDMAWIGADTTELTNLILPLIKNAESNEPIFKEEKYKNQEVIQLKKYPKRIILIGNQELQLPFDSTTSRKIVVFEVNGTLRKYYKQFTKFQTLKSEYNLEFLSFEKWLQGFTFFFSSIDNFINDLENIEKKGIHDFFKSFSRTLVQSNIKQSKIFKNIKNSEEKQIVSLMPHIKALLYEMKKDPDVFDIINEEIKELDLYYSEFSISDFIVILKQLAEKIFNNSGYRLSQREAYKLAIKEFLRNPVKILENYSPIDLAKLKEKEQSTLENILESNRGESVANTVEEKLLLESGAIKIGASTYSFEHPIFSRLKMLISCFPEEFETEDFLYNEYLRSTSGRYEKLFITLTLYLYGKKHGLDILGENQKYAIIYNFVENFVRVVWPTAVNTPKKEDFFVEYLIKNLDLTELEKYLKFCSDLQKSKNTKEEDKNFYEKVNSEVQEYKKFKESIQKEASTQNSQKEIDKNFNDEEFYESIKKELEEFFNNKTNKKKEGLLKTNFEYEEKGE